MWACKCSRWFELTSARVHGRLAWLLDVFLYACFVYTLAFGCECQATPPAARLGAWQRCRIMVARGQQSSRHQALPVIALPWFLFLLLPAAAVSCSRQKKRMRVPPFPLSAAKAQRATAQALRAPHVIISGSSMHITLSAIRLRGELSNPRSCRQVIQRALRYAPVSPRSTMVVLR